MKKFLLAAVATGLSFFSWSQNLDLKDEASAVTFKIKNFGLQVDGSFRGLKGTIVFNPNDLSASVFDVVIDATTINTGIEMRDSHLKKEEYFDVKNFNTIRFASTAVEPTSTKGKYQIIGNLTIKRKTKEIRFPFTVQQPADAYLFKGTFPLNRRDFGVGSGSFSLANDLIVQLSVKATINKL